MTVTEVERLHSRSKLLAARFQEGGERSHIDEAVVLARQALDLCSPGHAMGFLCLNLLFIHLWARYNRFGGPDDPNEAILLNRETLTLCPTGHPYHSIALSNLAASLNARYEHVGAADDLNQAILLNREALALHPTGHPCRAMSLNNLAAYLRARYRQVGAIDDLNQAILLHQEALVLRPKGHLGRSISLYNLAGDLAARHKQTGAAEDLNQAILLNREALVLRTMGLPDRSDSLSSLAAFLRTRYEQAGATDDLNEAILLNREAVALRTTGHPGRSDSLTTLAYDLKARYDRLGTADDLNQAILLDREALALRPTGHPNRAISLGRLACNLRTRYEQVAITDDLNKAILLDREALALRPTGHPDRPMFLNSLAADLGMRYKQIGATDDLNQAILLNREALALCPTNHRLRSSSLINLALNLRTRYEQVGAADDLNQAILLDREALALRPSGHPLRSRSLNNLAVDLMTRYRQVGAEDDLNEAILHDREALKLRPSGHPERPMSLSNLAADLTDRFKKVRSVDDLNEAILLNREALALRPAGHLERSTSVHNLAHNLRELLQQSNQLNRTEEVFSLYAELADVPQLVSFRDLSAARVWIDAAENLHHHTTVLAYDTFLQLLNRHIATFPLLPKHLDVLKNHTSSLAVDAFSACIRSQSPWKAVELLEQGRSTFWSQLNRLHSTPVGDAIKASGPEGEVLADRFIHLTSQVRNALGTPGPDQHDRACRFSVELQRVTDDIRKLPGLSRFLLPLPFSDLRQAASEGPVVIVNASKYGCDALIVLLDRDPVHIPLEVDRDRVGQLSIEVHKLTIHARQMDVSKDFGFVLRQIWDEVVSPIANALQKVHPLQSRVWWCPTAEFCYLPLHAAGPYRKGQLKFADLYVSSYAPTLGALIHARRPSDHAPTEKHFIAIGQAQAKGASRLPSVGAELAGIAQRVDGLAQFTRIEGSDSCISRVADELGKNEWVHLACHGIPNRERPFESAFALHDGRFTIQHIMQRRSENAEFAYLSACHTTVGDAKSPDEMIHLASAVQFAGFRSVIGTMWAVDDGLTRKITSMFYDNMVSASGRLDHTRAAFALHKTMREVRGVLLDQRILYVHIGA